MKCDICEVADSSVKYSQKYKHTLCAKHYRKAKRYGDPNKLNHYSPNDITYLDSYAEIILRNIKCEEVARVKVSLESVPIVRQYKWCLTGDGYAKATINKKKVRMHRLLLGPVIGQEVDHINGEPLDNRLCNIRICTPSQNQWNRGKSKRNKSGTTGVHFSYTNNGWVAQIMQERKVINLGTHETKEAAIKARKEAEVLYRGEYVRKEA